MRRRLGSLLINTEALSAVQFAVSLKQVVTRSMVLTEVKLRGYVQKGPQRNTLNHTRGKTLIAM